jgi:DNA-binding LacI/PurR family transcriptional regulator
MEDDLIILVKKVLEKNMIAGKEVGIISYNETPIKQIILDGITTISADFNLMGEMAAKMILQKSTEHVPVPFHLTLRNSL